MATGLQNQSNYSAEPDFSDGGGGGGGGGGRGAPGAAAVGGGGGAMPRNAGFPLGLWFR